MRLLATEQYNKVQFLFICNYYDMHLAGLCIYKNKVCLFFAGYDTTLVSIYSLAVIEKVWHLAKKKLFEICVGYHWTYPYRKQGLNYRLRKPEWFWRIIFNCYYGRWY